MEYGIFADLDTPIKRGSSHRTEFNDDEIMQRVMKIDKMVRSLVKKWENNPIYFIYKSFTFNYSVIVIANFICKNKNKRKYNNFIYQKLTV